MKAHTAKRVGLLALVAFSIVYGLVVLWYVPTQPTIPLRCLVADSGENAGLRIADVSQLGNLKGAVPEVGDYLTEVAGQPIRSFSDYSRVHGMLRHWKLDAAAVLPQGKDVSEERAASELPVVEIQPEKSPYVLVWFLRPGEDLPLKGHLQVTPPPVLGVSFTLIWFVLQLCVVAVGGLAFWNRPFDLPVRTFFALSAVTLIAFVGGSHWWILSGNLFLILAFAIAAVMLPAVLLHFFLVYPFPTRMMSRAPRLTRIAIYSIPTATAVVLAGLICLSAMLSQDLGPGPFAATLERIAGNLVADLLPLVRKIAFGFFGIALVYFVLSLLALARSLREARNPLERNQVRSILFAGLFATLPIAYTISLSILDPVGFAFGEARIPMFLASMAFMLAYGIGIARYKLMLIDQVISRGVWYYSASAGLGLIFATLIAVGAVNALHQDLALFGHSIPLILVLATSVLVLSWVRDAVQRILDRRFFSEKYQLDKALQRMNRVVSSVLEPEAVSDSLLTSCRDVLRIEQAALYLRKGQGLEFRMFTASGRARFPLQITLQPDAFEAVSRNTVLQRVGHSQSATQSLLRELRAEVVHGLEMQESLGGLLVLGNKPNNSPFSAEDLAFVSAMARIAGVALHCADVQRDVARLNQDLQLKMDKIEDQDRQLTALQHELAALSKLPAPTTTTETEFLRGDLKGHSNAIMQVLETVRKVAGSDSSVLIRGESGTGKELLARALHNNSPRRIGPLVSVHCAALSSTLLESELFGHVKGAFTDAKQDKIGRFELANGGTLFLDEIGDISLDVQVKLLRVLQERTFEPVGSTKSVTVDVRIVAATHRNLEQLIAEGKFREDLFYRLNVISVTLPPLRERKEDIFELALHFLRRASERSGKSVLKIDEEALKVMEAYSWPGNIRELQNVVERAVVLAEGDSIRLADLPAELRQTARSAHSATLPRPLSERPAISAPPTQIALRRKTLSLDTDEKAVLQAALEECRGNKAEAARLLGIPRSTFFSKLKKHGLG